MIFKLKYLLTIVLSCVVVGLSAQEGRIIKVLQSGVAILQQVGGKTTQRLVGDVMFEHDGATMFCDSAWFTKSTNSMEAFGLVRIVQGDSLHVTGRYLKYDGNTRLAEMRDSVVVIRGQSRLETDSLNFNRLENVAYFFGFGKINHQEMLLTSKKGYFYPDSDDYFAQDSVRLIHPDYTIFSEELKYNINTHITYFLERTHIVSDSARIICQYGWYDTDNDISSFGENTVLYQENQTIWADSLFYDRNTKSGRAWKNIKMLDTVEHFMATGNYAEYAQNSGSSLITDSALVMYYENADTTYIHADTVFMHQTGDSARKIQAYYHVQIFKNDMQGRCDSLIYQENDALSIMYGEPILWAEGSQLTSDTIKLKMRNNVAEKIIMNEESLIVSQEDSLRYSQISGRGMIAWLKDNELSKIDVLANAETIYYAKDDKTGEFIGVNKEVSSRMKIYRADGLIQRIDFIGSPDGAFLPDEQTSPVEMRLRNFTWLEHFRPKKLSEIFIWVEK